MNLEGRRKDYREAADSGLLLWRENFINFLPFFAVPFWLCAFAMRLLPGRAQYLSWIILWLLKPLFDRPILHIISVRFFESGASMKHLCQGLGKSIVRGLAGDLLWRRFSPLRSAMMPVRVLEPTAERTSLQRSAVSVASEKRRIDDARSPPAPHTSSGRGKRQITERRELLKKGGLGYCSALTFWGISLELALLAGELLFITIMAELIRKGFASSLGSSLKDAEIYIFALWCFNYMLVETLYVCMGFSLYINSRIEVEGWDIEIMFRSLAEKIKTKSINGALIISCIACLFQPARAFSAEREPAAASGVPLEKLQTILDSPDFGGEKDSWGIRLKNPRQHRDSPNVDFGPVLENLRRIFAFTLRFILIALIAGIIVFLLFYLHKFRRERVRGIDDPVTKALPEKNTENPEVLLEKAAVFFEQGNLRLAWGYCTAAAILSWTLYRGIVFPPNATESDCANMVNSMTANNTLAFCNEIPRAKLDSPSCIDEAGVFDELIKNWVNFAYAGRLPPQGSFEDAVALCISLRTINET